MVKIANIFFKFQLEHASNTWTNAHASGACPEIRKRGGPKSKNLFFLAFQFFRGGGPAQKIIFSTKKVAKYRRNSLIFALMTFFFFAFQFLGGGAQAPWAPPLDTSLCMIWLRLIQ